MFVRFQTTINSFVTIINGEYVYPEHINES